MKDDEIRRQLNKISKPAEPRREDVGYILSLYNKVFRGEIAEFKCVNTRRGVDVFETKKRRL